MALGNLLPWRRGVAARRSTDAPSGLLIVSAGGLGDTALFSLILPRLIPLANGEPVTLVLRRDGAGMGFLFQGLADIVPVDFDRYAKERRYRRAVDGQFFQANYRLALTSDFLRHPKRDEAMLNAAEASETLAMKARAWAKYDRDLTANEAKFDRIFDSGPDHIDKVVRWSNYANWLTGNDVPPPRINLPEDRLPPADALPRETILLAPFSAVKHKQSPAGLYEDLNDLAGPERDIVLTGAPGDLDKNPDFKPLLDRPNVRFDDRPFSEMLPLLRAAKLLVSVDTAAMHLGVMTGTPTLCLASAAYVGEIVPYAAEITPPNAHFMYTPMDCEGCLGACSLPEEDGRFPCVARLDRAAILAKAEILLNGTGSS
jgi:hypothetical protein